MRKVVYFHAGTVADFSIEDEDYDIFVGQLHSGEAVGDRALLDQARKTLETCLTLDQGEADEMVIAAAAFIWRHFNEATDEARRIDGDIIVIDETGEGRDVHYAPLAAVNLSPSH